MFLPCRAEPLAGESLGELEGEEKLDDESEEGEEGEEGTCSEFNAGEDEGEGAEAELDDAGADVSMLEEAELATELSWLDALDKADDG